MTRTCSLHAWGPCNLLADAVLWLAPMSCRRWTRYLGLCPRQAPCCRPARAVQAHHLAPRPTRPTRPWYRHSRRAPSTTRWRGWRRWSGGGRARPCRRRRGTAGSSTSSRRRGGRVCRWPRPRARCAPRRPRSLPTTWTHSRCDSSCSKHRPRARRWQGSVAWRRRRRRTRGGPWCCCANACGDPLAMPDL
jgi:hypothetical protein